MSAIQPPKGTNTNCPPLRATHFQPRGFGGFGLMYVPVAPRILQPAGARVRGIASHNLESRQGFDEQRSQAKRPANENPLSVSLDCCIQVALGSAFRSVPCSLVRCSHRDGSCIKHSLHLGVHGERYLRQPLAERANLVGVDRRRLRPQPSRRRSVPPRLVPLRSSSTAVPMLRRRC